MYSDLLIFQKTYDLLVWMMPVVNKFPKDQKFVLGQRLENKVLDILNLIIKANSKLAKEEYFYAISLGLDEARVYVRLSKDLRFISIKQYEVFALRLNEIGKLFGGWAGSRKIDHVNSKIHMEG